MQRFATRSGQLGLVGGIRQQRSDLVTVVEPSSPFAPEARKGQLYLVVEADEGAARGAQASQLVSRVARRVFYEDDSFSMTSALRAAVRAANKALYEQNFNQPVHQRAYVGLTCAVLKDNDLFVAQVQPTQAYVLSEGRVRPLPAHPSWDPAHVSVAPFVRAGAIGASLFIEPELYRCTLGVGGGALFCSSNFARLLGRADLELLLRDEQPETAIERLAQVAAAHELDDAHALLVAAVPALSPAARSAPLSPSGVGERSRLAARSLGGWVAGWAGRGGGRARKHSSEPRRLQPAADPLYTLPEQPTHSPTPPARPAPLEVGESLDERYERSRRERADVAPLRQENLPPSTFLGEDMAAVPGATRRIDLSDAALAAETRPYRPRYELRPLVDLSWGERLALPFRKLALLFEEGVGVRRARRSAPTPRPIRRGEGLSYRRTRAPFPWALLLGLVLVVSALIFYGLTLTRQNDQQLALEYFATADQRLAAVRESPDESVALEALDLARQAIDEVRASPEVTRSNVVLWTRYQELQREYERSLAAVQRLTFFDNLQVLATHPVPTGQFASVVVPPPLANITDTAVLEGLRYLYVIDADAPNARLYRIPREGGTAQPYLSPNEQVGTSLVGPLRAALWRIDQVVAVDQVGSGFGYYFRNGNAWNYSKLGGSEIWTVRDRLDLEEFDGNLYVWGAEPNQVLKFPSGRYGDTPEYWLDQGALADLDLSTVVDMVVDREIYLLRSNGTVLVMSGNRQIGEIKPEAISPPISAVTRLFITGSSPEDGSIFLLEPLSQRIIQIDKITGKIIQQVKVRPDGDLQLDALSDVVVDESASRPILYLINGGQLLRAELPLPPRALREPGSAGTAGPAPSATGTP